MKALRIGILTATFPPYRAGTGNIAFEQAARLARRGHDVTIITATYPGEPQDPEGVRVVRLEPLLRMGNAPLLPSLLVAHGYDVVHLHQPFIFGAEMAAGAAWLRRMPLVSSFHNELVADGLRGVLFRAYSRTAVPLTLRASRVIAVLTPGQADSVPQLRAETRRHPDKLHIVPNAVDHERFHAGPIDQSVRNELDIPAEATVAIACAALDEAHRTKRIDVAISATAELEGLHLIVVGDGPLRTGLERQARSLGIGERVHFAGFQDTELPAYYRAADVCILCSELESFGLVQVEAMSCGRPVIVSDLPGARDVSVPGVTGWHVKPADPAALAAALTAFGELTAERLNEMGRAARDHVLAKFTWDRSIDALERALAAALN